MRLKWLLLLFLGMTSGRPGENKKSLEKMKLTEKKASFFAKTEKKPFFVKASKHDKESTPLTLEEYFKEQEKHKEDNNEREKICMAAKDEMLPNFLTKLGLITRMIEDVTQFRIRLKRSRSRLNEDKEDIEEGKKQRKKKTNDKDDVGLSVEATEAIWKMKKKGKLEDMALSSYKKPVMLYKSKTNKLGLAKHANRRRNNDKDKLPSCFGYQYLYAVDAVDDNGRPDVEVFQEYFSDLTDDKLALQLSDIIHDCSEPVLAANKSTAASAASSCPDARNHRQWGPEVEEDGFVAFPESCQEACLVDSDCATGELCCSNSCGGHTCYLSKSGSLKANQGQSRSQRSLCQDADEILQCVYDRIKKKVCINTAAYKKVW